MFTLLFSYDKNGVHGNKEDHISWYPAGLHLKFLQQSLFFNQTLF